MNRTGRPDDDTDRRLMAAALRLGRRQRGLTGDNPAVGALVVRFDGEVPVIIGRGATCPPGERHAERVALDEAGEAARGATLYVTLEPCSHHGRTPPCAEATVNAGVARVVSAIEDPNPIVAGRGHAMLRAAGIEVSVGVLADEAYRAHAGYISCIAHGVPHATLKMAVSRDRRIAGPGRSRVAITGPDTLGQVHMMRAETDAILVGLGTVLTDDPLLTVRLPGLELRSPIRVVLDRELGTPLESQLVETAATVPLWIVAGEGASPERRAALERVGVTVMTLPLPDDPAAVMKALGQRKITRLMVEGGAETAGNFLHAGAIDEIVLFSAPIDIGPEGLAAPGALETTVSDPAFTLTDERTFGRDRMRIWKRS